MKWCRRLAQAAWARSIARRIRNSVESDESGQKQIYVRPFPEVETGRWQISPGGGTRPLWARNGHELFYLDPARRLMAVPVQSSPTFSAGNPAKLFDTPYLTPNNGVTYDVSPDGQRFVMIKAERSRARSRMLHHRRWWSC